MLSCEGEREYGEGRKKIKNHKLARFLFSPFFVGHRVPSLNKRRFEWIHLYRSMDADL